MRVLSDGARRLINEMKKLRLSLIFNERGARARARASERGYNGGWSPGPERRRTTKYHFPEFAHLHAAGSRGPRGASDVEESRLHSYPREPRRCVSPP